MARDTTRASDSKSKIPVAITGPSVIRPYDANVGRVAGRAAHAAVAKAFGRAKAFEVVSRPSREMGFAVNCVIEPLTFDDKARVLKLKVTLDLAQTPGTSTFDAVSEDGEEDVPKPDRVESVAEHLATVVAENAAAKALRLCERRAKS